MSPIAYPNVIISKWQALSKVQANTIHELLRNEAEFAFRFFCFGEKHQTTSNNNKNGRQTNFFSAVVQRNANANNKQ